VGEASEGQARVTRPAGDGLRQRALALALDPANVLGVVLLLALVLRGIWLDQPPGGLIWDETYYVNAARVIDGLPIPAGDHYADAPAGIDPNAEHPPLGKVVIAASMSVFGDSALGWRLPSIVAGMLALLAFYGIVRRAGAGPWLAILALALLAFDNLTLVHGRIGTLDILFVAPMLIGAWLASRGRWGWAGVAIGIALLVKLTAIFAALALGILLLLELVGGWRDRAPVRRTVKRGVTFAVPLLVVWFVGLWALDLRFTTFTSPVAHLQHMVSYGANLEQADRSRGVGCSGSSEPWQWLLNECQIGYFKVTENPTGDPNVTRTTVEFRGALNAFLADAMPLALAFAAWAAWRRHDPLATWAIVWAGANYLPYVALALISDRVMYLYYMVPVVPGVAAAVAVLLTRSGLPRIVGWSFVALFAAGVIAYFPFRTTP
jgi:predicted membrane-bound dolichyl-phosphate-mannose-protein mannosyltransferase